MGTSPAGCAGHGQPDAQNSGARGSGRAFVEPLLKELQDPGSDLSRRWDREHDQHVLQVLLAQLEPDFAPPTWQAFQRLLAGEEPKAVAAALGLSVNSVFLPSHASSSGCGRRRGSDRLTPNFS